MYGKKKFRFRFTLTSAIDFDVEASDRDEAERYLRNRVEYYYVDHPGELKVIDRSIVSIDCSDNLPYDMKFYRPEEVVRELAVE